MKKLLALTTAIFLVVALFAGTTLVSAASSPLEEYTIRIVTAGETPADQQAVFDKISADTKDTLNIKIEALYTPWGDYLEKHKTMAAAGDKFDIYLNFSFDILPAFVRKQALRLNELLDQFGPDIKANISASDMMDGYANENLIAIPAVYTKDSVYFTAVVRKDLREKYDCPPITTIDTLAQFLETIAANEPQMSPIDGGSIATFMARDGKIKYPENTKTVIFGTGNATAVYWADEGEDAFVVKSFYESDKAIYMVELGARGYNNKWWPKDLNAGRQSKELLLSDQAAFINIDFYHFSQMVNDIKSTVPEAELEWTIIQPDQPIEVSPSNNFAQICSTSQNPERAMMFLNWIQASQANYDLWYYGIEGTHYTLATDGSLIYPDGIAPTNDGGTNPYAPTPWWFKNAKYDRAVETDAQITKDCVTFIRDAARFPIPVNTYGFVIDPDPILTELTQIDKLVSEQWNPLINGQLQGADYDKYIAALYTAGLQKVIVETQAQLDTYLAAKGINK